MSPTRDLLTRSNSICPPPETVLLDSVHNNDLATIRTLATANPALLTYQYPATTKTILQSACSDANVTAATVQTLIELGADVTGDSEWNPLHLAAQNRNSAILEVLLTHLAPDQINACVDGNTALHSLVKGLDVQQAGHEDLFCRHVALLLRHGVNVNQGDGKHVSAVLWAARYGYASIVTAILESSVEHVDLDSHKLRGKSARDLIVEKGLYGGRLPEPGYHPPSKDRLFALLKQSREEEFVEYFDSLSLTNPSDCVNAMEDGGGTLLQLGCEKGLVRVVRYLLNRGANVNLATRSNPKLPIEVATEHGYCDIVQALLERPADSDSVLVTPSILCGLLKKLDCPKFDHIDHDKCLHLLLHHSRHHMDVNGEDELGNTPLHYSLRYGGQDVTNSLLKLGASLACKNRFDVMPIEDMKPEALEAHLDSCVQFNPARTEKRDFEVTFDYRTLLPPRREWRKLEERSSEDLAPETELIAYMSRAQEFRSLLKHPVVVSFLLMKWHRIRWLFFTNLVFYVLFVLSLVAYIFEHLGHSQWVLLNLTFSILVLRELFQITVAPRSYFRNFENLVEVVLIVVTAMLLCVQGEDSRRQLSSVAILLSAFELVLMVGQHPKLSTNVVMLKTVSVTFFKLLLWYSLLIVAFALSFYILFAKEVGPRSRNNTDAPEEEEEEEDLFTGPGGSLFKTIVMLTGEFDAGSINFHTYPVTSKLIFTLFVFMITIILLNLLNGLAVSDTHAIKNDAELVGLIARAQHIFYVESMLLGNVVPTSVMRVVHQVFCCVPRSRSCTFFKPLARRVCLFTRAQCCQLCVQPNHHGRIYYEFDGLRKGGCTRPCSDTYLDKETVQRIHDIVKRRRFQGGGEVNVHSLCAEIAALQCKLDQISKMLMAQRES